ncbi:hypothetical protein ACKWTF_002926 [Chironomus riparius]
MKPLKMTIICNYSCCRRQDQKSKHIVENIESFWCYKRLQMKIIKESCICFPKCQEKFHSSLKNVRTKEEERESVKKGFPSKYYKTKVLSSPLRLCMIMNKFSFI